MLINGPGPGIMFFWWLALGFHVLFCIVTFFFFFFFWINRLCTLNSQKPSLELQSPKSQGFNFNWFSCCKHNPYPPLWTFFFFFYDLCEYQNFSFFFFFFFFSNCFGIPFASSHNTPRFTKKIPPPTTNRYSDFFFFNIATSCLYIPRVLAYSPTLHWHLF